MTMADVIEVDCMTGTSTCRPMTPEEAAAQAAVADAGDQAAAAAAQQRATLISAVAASTDPALIALAQLQGVLPPPAPAAAHQEPTP